MSVQLFQVLKTHQESLWKKMFPCSVNRKVPKPSQDTEMCGLNPEVETPSGILSRARPLLTLVTLMFSVWLGA